MLIQSGDLTLRLMRDDEDDYATMARWLTDPRVLEFYEGRDNPFPIERVRQEYSPRVMANDGVTPCLFELDGAPVGYAQFYPIDEDGRIEYDLDSSKDLNGMFGIDQFIGQPELWGTGLGTRGVRLLLRYLFDDLAASEVILDPHTSNLRAIRCYEKVGFRKVKMLPAHELHEGFTHDCWLMSITRGA